MCTSINTNIQGIERKIKNLSLKQGEANVNTYVRQLIEESFPITSVEELDAFELQIEQSLEFRNSFVSYIQV